MKTNRSILTWCWLLLLALSLPALTSHAQTAAPNYMSYQGYLTDGSGNPLGSTAPQAYSVVFRIYTVGTGGSPIYSELQTVTADKGNFSVLLGQGVKYNSEPFPTTGLAGIFSANTATYIEMTILGIGNSGGNVTLAPRLQLVATPYAFAANTASQVVNASGGSLITSPAGSLDLLGNVGVGTSSPTYPFQVNGNMAASSLSILSSGGLGGNLLQMYASTIDPNGSWSLYYNFYGNNNFAIARSPSPGSFPNNQALVLSTNGNVGIGIISPSYNLSVGGAAEVDANGANIGVASGMDLYFGAPGTGEGILSNRKGVYDLELVTDGTPRLTIANSGTVGINNNTPNSSYSLDVNGAAHVSGTLSVDNTVNTASYFSSSGGYVASSIQKVNGQGSYFGWNRDGYGGTWIINQKGVGTGGFNFAESDVNNNLTNDLVINYNGTVECPVTSAGYAGMIEDYFSGANDRYGLAEIGGYTTLYTSSTYTPSGISFGQMTGTASYSAQMTINHSGYVGIGTASPGSPLEVVGTTGNQYLNGYYDSLAPSGSGGGFPNGFNTGANTSNPGNVYSIYAHGRILCSELDLTSDARIKEVVGRSDTAKDLATVRRLQVTDYRKIDKVQFGGRLEKGVIAQEVEAVVPEAVTASTNFIPNVYAPAKSLACTNQTLLVTMAQPHGLVVGDVVKLITDTGDLQMTVTAVKSPLIFAVAQPEKATKRLFVYGKQVGDFRTVNYERLFTTGLGAIQELAKEVDQLKAQNARVSAAAARAAEQARAESSSEIADLKQMVAKLAKEVDSLKVASASRPETTTASLDR